MDWLERLLNQEWVRNEAISNYIIFFAGILVAIAGWAILRVISRSKPSIVRVEKFFEGSMIGIEPEIRDKLKITYEDQPIEGFYEVKFMVYNAGEAPIEDIHLIFAVEELSSIKVFEAVFTNEERVVVAGPVEAESEPDSVQPDTRNLNELSEFDFVDLDPDAFSIYLPFLNPYKGYDDYLGITIYTSKPVVVKGVVGKGVGWTTRYIDKTIYIEKVSNILKSTASPIAYWTVRIVNILTRAAI
jgi:hypothetical protein